MVLKKNETCVIVNGKINSIASGIYISIVSAFYFP